MQDEQTASAPTQGQATVAKVLLFAYHPWPPITMKMGDGRKCLFCSEVEYCFHLLILKRP